MNSDFTYEHRFIVIPVLWEISARKEDRRARRDMHDYYGCVNVHKYSIAELWDMREEEQDKRNEDNIASYKIKRKVLQI